MDAAHRTYLITFGCVLGFLLAYFMTGLNPVLLPWYFPLEHRWQWIVRPQTLAMDWYGRALWAVVGAAVLGGAAAAVVRRWKPADPTAVIRAVAVWAVTIFAFSAALFIYQLAPRHPFPAALPPGYQAR